MHLLKSIALVVLLLTVTLPLATPAYADGIIIPEPPICIPGPCPGPTPISQLAIKYHRVHVTIEDQVAIPHVDQLFRKNEKFLAGNLDLLPSTNSLYGWTENRWKEKSSPARRLARRTKRSCVPCAIQLCSNTQTGMRCKPQYTPSLQAVSARSNWSTLKCWKLTMG